MKIACGHDITDMLCTQFVCTSTCDTSHGVNTYYIYFCLYIIAPLKCSEVTDDPASIVFFNETSHCDHCTTSWSTMILGLLPSRLECPELPSSSVFSAIHQPQNGVCSTEMGNILAVDISPPVQWDSNKWIHHNWSPHGWAFVGSTAENRIMGYETSSAPHHTIPQHWWELQTNIHPPQNPNKIHKILLLNSTNDVVLCSVTYIWTHGWLRI